MSGHELRYLSQEDCAAAGVLDPELGRAAIRRLFEAKGRGEVREGQLSKIDLDDAGRRRLIAHTAHLGGTYPIGGVKWIPASTANPGRGLPRAVAMLILTDPDTALPVAVMDGTLVSLARTAGSAAVAVEELARPGAARVAVVGAGVTNRVVVRACASVLPGLTAVTVYDLDPGTGRRWAEEQAAVLGVPVDVACSARQAVTGADVVLCATHDALTPYLEAEWLAAGTTLVGISLRDATEGAVLACDRIVTADRDSFATGLTVPATLHLRGELPADRVVTISDIVLGHERGRRTAEERVFYDCWGLGATDVAVGAELLTRAAAAGLGTTLPLWESPHEVLGVSSAPASSRA